MEHNHGVLTQGQLRQWLTNKVAEESGIERWSQSPNANRRIVSDGIKPTGVAAEHESADVRRVPAKGELLLVGFQIPDLDRAVSGRPRHQVVVAADRDSVGPVGASR